MIGLMYALVAGTFIVYVVLDGFDFGAGALHLFVARGDAERREVLGAIGPVWNANEVWLIAGGGMLFFAFPQAYAAGFSGFYLPLTVVLWLLVIRGLSIELRSHLADPLWQAFWDAGLGFSSASMALVLGASLGNVLRGVPIGASGSFMAPWFTNFRVRGEAGVLDWYTVLLGAFALIALCAHGASYLCWQTSGVVRERAARSSRALWIAVAAGGLVCIVATRVVRPSLYGALLARPWSWIFVLIAAAGLAAAISWRDRRGFAGSCAFLAATLAATAAGLFPVLLPSTIDPRYDVIAYTAAPGAHGLRVGLGWWMIGIPLAAAYTVYLYRSLRR